MFKNVNIKLLLAMLTSSFLFASVCAADTAIVRLDPISRGNKLIIFVHGITSNATDAWTNEESGTYWPDLLLMNDIFFGADIIAYQYDSSYWGRGLSISEMAIAFSDDMKSPPISALEYDKVIFVAHSMGGLIVRRSLLDDSELRDITPAVFLYGVPSGGSSLASLLSNFSKNPAVADLARAITDDGENEANFLYSLRDEWRQSLIARTTWSYCAFEKEKTKKLGFEAQVVDKLSAELLCDSDIIGIDSDHVSLVTPFDATSPAHERLIDWYSGVFRDANRDLAAESANQIAIVRCGRDRYEDNLYDALAEDIAKLNFEWRYTRDLPYDWRAHYKNFIWSGHKPSTLVVHFSCFQEGKEDDENRNESLRDFVSFLEDLTYENVRVLAFSRGFGEGVNSLQGKLEAGGISASAKDYFFGACPRIDSVALPAKGSYSSVLTVRNRMKDRLKSLHELKC